MSKYPFLRGDEVTLRVPTESDVSFLTGLINHPNVWPTLAKYEPETERDERGFVDSLSDTDDVHLLVCVDGDPAGVVGLNDVEATHGLAELGYLLHPDYWDEGYMTDAVGRIVEYAFDDLRLNKVFANAFETNPATQRVLEKNGFEQEGHFRDHMFVRGEYVDVFQYGLLAPEFEP